MSANPRDPVPSTAITTDGAVVDIAPAAEPDVFDELESYTASPATAGVPTTYEALSISDFLDFRSHFDPGDLSQGVTVSVRLPEDLARMMDRLIHREDVPFATKSDLLREGVFVLLKALVDKLRVHDPMLLSLMAEAKVRAETKFAIERHDAWKEMRENLEIQLVFWLDRGEVLECGRAIQSYWNEAQGIQYPAWREHVCQVLRTHPLVKAAALAALAGGFLFSPELHTFTGGWK